MDKPLSPFWFRYRDSFTRKRHAEALSRSVGAAGSQVLLLEDDRYHVVVPCHRPEPVGRWLDRQTPDVEWILEELGGETIDDEGDSPWSA